MFIEIHPLYAEERETIVSITQTSGRYRSAERITPSAIRFNPFILVALYAAITVCWLLVTKPSNTWLNWYLTFVWSLYLPAALAGTIRVLLKGDKLFVLSNYKQTIDNLVVFIVPSVARHDTYPALRRVIESVEAHAPHNLTQWRLDLVIDEGAQAENELCTFIADKPHVRLLIVPRTYKTKNHTRSKARANQYAADIRKLEGEAVEDVYVYHLDDDTHVEEDTIASIAEFIDTKSGTFLLAQGVLAFPHELSPSHFCRMADSIRPADDITRCGIFTGDLGTPLAGLHGEHMLVSAQVEDQIGWDFGNTLVEDAFFGLSFARLYPGRSCVLKSFSYGASPASVRDLIQQRKRWAAGLLKLVLGRNEFPLLYRIPIAYTIACWILSPFYFVGFVLVISHLCGVNNTSPVVLWAIFPWTFTLAYSVWQYIEGLRINLSVSKTQKHQIVYTIIMLPCIYFFTIVEAFAGLCGLYKFIVRDSKFEVIKKEI